MEKTLSRRLFVTAAGAAVATAAVSGPLGAAGIRLHPVRGWHGNEYLFEVTGRGNATHMTVYRALGSKWERIGATTIRKGQHAPHGSYLQKIWFRGRKLRSIRADMGNTWWRSWPGEDSNGGGDYIN